MSEGNDNVILCERYPYLRDRTRNTSTSTPCRHHLSHLPVVADPATPPATPLRSMARRDRLRCQRPEIGSTTSEPSLVRRRPGLPRSPDDTMRRIRAIREVVARDHGVAHGTVRNARVTRPPSAPASSALAIGGACAAMRRRASACGLGPR
ncbi:MAG: hypothetical protein ACLRM9_09615 [Collinsella aerofaciens]